MIAADRPVQRPHDAKLLHVDARGDVRALPRAELPSILQRGDLVVANDAATLPASLHGVHARTGARIEVRLAGREREIAHVAIVFGAGDYRTRTEHRQPPPALCAGDRVRFQELDAIVERTLGHPRLVLLRFEATAAQFWRALAAQGRPIQYAHLHEPLELWDVWTPIAAAPVAFEPPSAGFTLDWRTLTRFRQAGVEFATLTHAAGISSTGDDQLDRRLPFDERYVIPERTARAIARARQEGGRVIAIGTTVVRALEHSASCNGVVDAGAGVATGRIDASTRLAVVDAILSGAHEPDASHHELLHAFASREAMQRADAALNALGFRTHEFGDSVLIERASAKYSHAAIAAAVIEEHAQKQALVADDALRILGRFSPTGRDHVVQESRHLSAPCGLVDLCG